MTTESLIVNKKYYSLYQYGIESRWERDFPPVQTGPGAHHASFTMDTRSFPVVNRGRGVLLTTLPPSTAAAIEE